MSGAEIIAFDDDDLELKAGLIRARARLDAGNGSLVEKLSK